MKYSTHYALCSRCKIKEVIADMESLPKAWQTHKIILEEGEDKKYYSEDHFCVECVKAFSAWKSNT